MQRAKRRVFDAVPGEDFKTVAVTRKKRTAPAKAPSVTPVGARCTRQRQIVLEVMRCCDDHPTAAQVFQRVRRRQPGIAAATIYNALRWWVERGELREFTFGDAATRYDRNRERHDHAICMECRRLIDVSIRLPRGVAQQVRRHTGLQVMTHHVQFLGLCPACTRRR